MRGLRIAFAQRRANAKRRRRLLLLLRQLFSVFLHILGCVRVEFIAAAAATDVVGFPHVRNRYRPSAAADDALGPAVTDREGLAFLGRADSPFLRKERPAFGFHFIVIQEAV